jgi:hypothetical protein
MGENLCFIHNNHLFPGLISWDYPFKGRGPLKFSKEYPVTKHQSITGAYRLVQPFTYMSFSLDSPEPNSGLLTGLIYTW